MKTDRDGYPLYRRRSPKNGGHIVKKMIKGKEVVIDNRWLVPYSPLLCKISMHILMLNYVILLNQSNIYVNTYIRDRIWQ